jgi:predicted NAD/FAD-dependent oxidoreductase
MVIGVIGASLAGLAAARILGQKGHQVTVFEKAESWSGRFTTVEVGVHHTRVDIHTPYLVANNETTKAFFAELTNKKLIKPIEATVKSVVSGEIANTSMNHEGSELFASTQGMSEIANYLARYADIKFGAEVVGLTYIGDNRGKKAAWMINLASFEVFELDAVIVALPAPQARQVLENAQDETEIRSVLAQLHDIRYTSRHSVVATYPNKTALDFLMLELGGMDVDFIINESKKKDTTELILSIHSTDTFYNRSQNLKNNEIIDHLLKEAASVLGDFVYNPEMSVLARRKYVAPHASLNLPFIDVQGLDGKLAVVGDFFEGNSLETAFVSGVSLAQKWLK